MSRLQYTLQRVQAVIEEIEQIKGSEFPYSDSKDALDSIAGVFEDDLRYLKTLDSASEQETIQQASSTALKNLFNYLPLLGFILRSTNVRNAFEIVGPFSQLATKVLSQSGSKNETKETKIVFSSEWDYSPLSYHGVSRLTDFVMIGMPATESSNPLLIPLAGHELGHALWLKQNLAINLLGSIKKAILDVCENNWPKIKSIFHLSFDNLSDAQQDVFGDQVVNSPTPWVIAQAEEMFCDFVGLLLFGESFLHAFAYLLCPNLPNRPPTYPPIKTRAKYLEEAAKENLISVPKNFKDYFGNEESGFLPTDEFSLQLADEALVQLTDKIKKIAIDLCSDVSSKKSKEPERVYLSIKKVVPAEKCKNLADIINGGWLAYHDENLWRNTLWQELLQIEGKKEKVLKELILKNIEIFDIEYINSKEKLKKETHA